jgi:hypothetical protein
MIFENKVKPVSLVFQKSFTTSNNYLLKEDNGFFSIV